MNMEAKSAEATIAVPHSLLLATLGALDDASHRQADTVKFFSEVMAAGDCRIERDALYSKHISTQTGDAVRKALDTHHGLSLLTRHITNLIDVYEKAADAAGYEKLRNEYREIAASVAKLDPANHIDWIKFGTAWRRARTLQCMKGGVPMGAYTSLAMMRERFLDAMQALLKETHDKIKTILKRSPDRTKRSAAKTAELDTLQDRADDIAGEIEGIGGKPARITDDQPPAAETSPADQRAARYRDGSNLNR